MVFGSTAASCAATKSIKSRREQRSSAGTRAVANYRPQIRARSPGSSPVPKASSPTRAANRSQTTSSRKASVPSAKSFSKAYCGCSLVCRRRLQGCDEIDFHQRAARQFGHRDGGARRFRMVKVRGLNRVHGREVDNVLTEYGRFDDVIEGSAGGCQDRFQILHNLASLFLDAAGHQGAGFGIERNLAGGVDEIANLDRLLIRPDRFGRLVRGNGMFDHDKSS